MRPARRAIVLAVAGVVAAIAGLAAAGCASHTDYLVVTVDHKAAVPGSPATISVSLANAGTTRMDSLMLDGKTLPIQFSISTPGRTGALDIAVDAVDSSGLVVGHGTHTASIGDATVTVTLDTTDFVVNTDYAGDQFPSDDFEANGFQLAATPAGDAWISVYRDSCGGQDSCNIYARRFDAIGQATSSQAAAGTNAFVVSAKPTTISSTPAIATNHTSSVVVWDFYDTGTATTSGVACRAIDPIGGLGATQAALAPDAADVVSVAALPDDNFIVAWKTIISGNDQIRMAVVQPDCSLVGAVQTVASGASASDFLHRGSVAISGAHALFAWITNDDLHVRIADSAGGFLTADALLLPQTPTESVAHARVTADVNGGYVLAARWALKSGMGADRIDLVRLDANGALVGTPTLVTDQTGSDFDSSESFGIAGRGDGSALIVWHACSPFGDDSQCGVFGQLMPATGTPPPSFTVPTTTLGDQKRPSAVALRDGYAVVWADASAKPPDTAGLAARARIVYPTAQ